MICTMKVQELLQISSSIVKALHKFGIKPSDYMYLPMYEEYKRMKSKGEKTSYIVAVLSDKYNMCERKVYKVIKKMQKDCIIPCS